MAGGNADAFSFGSSIGDNHVFFNNSLYCTRYCLFARAGNNVSWFNNSFYSSGAASQILLERLNSNWSFYGNNINAIIQIAGTVAGNVSNNSFFNNIINSTILGTTYGIQISRGAGNKFYGNVIQAKTDAIQVGVSASFPYYTVDTLFYNNTLNANRSYFLLNSTGTWIENDTWLNSSMVHQMVINSSANVTVVNITGFDKTKIAWGTNLLGLSQVLTVRNYIRPNLTDAFSHPLVATINISNNKSVQLDYETTVANGLGNWTQYIEWFGNNTLNTTNTPLLFNATKNTYTSNVSYISYTVTATQNILLPDNLGPVILLIFPDNGTFNSNTSIQFQFIPIDNGGVLNATLWTNFSGTWGVNISTTVLTNNSVNIINPVGVQKGVFIWNILVCDTSNNCSFNTTANWTLTTINNSIIIATLNFSNLTQFRRSQYFWLNLTFTNSTVLAGNCSVTVGNTTAQNVVRTFKSCNGTVLVPSSVILGTEFVSVSVIDSKGGTFTNSTYAIFVTPEGNAALLAGALALGAAGAGAYYAIRRSRPGSMS